jgi:hypothetical protein
MNKEHLPYTKLKAQICVIDPLQKIERYLYPNDRGGLKMHSVDVVSLVND